MTHLIEQLSQSPFVHAMGWTLADFVWQGCAVAGLLAVTLIAMRRSSALSRYAAACAALLLMAALPMVTLSIVYHSAHVESARGTNAVAERIEVAPQPVALPIYPSRVRSASNASSSADPASDGAEHVWISAIKDGFAASLPWCVAAGCWACWSYLCV